MHKGRNFSGGGGWFKGSLAGYVLLKPFDSDPINLYHAELHILSEPNMEVSQPLRHPPPSLSACVNL